MKVNDKVKLINNECVCVQIGSIGVITKNVTDEYPVTCNNQEMYEVDFDDIIQHVEERQLELIKEEKEIE